MNLLHGDCLEHLKDIPDQSVDLILTDPPYGSTMCKWDVIIPFDALWPELKRVIKPNGAIVLTASQPFTTALIASNIKAYRHAWVWEKNFATNFFHAKRMPLRTTEDVIVFGYSSPQYFPQKTDGHIPTQSARGRSDGVLYHGVNRRDYDGGDTTRYPTNVLRFKAADPKNRLHPTQKPVALLEYLIKTYTLPGETVLDFTMGSGSTGVACINTSRQFVGIEKDDHYFEVAKSRLNKTLYANEQANHPHQTNFMHVDAPKQHHSGEIEVI